MLALALALSAAAPPSAVDPTPLEEQFVTERDRADRMTVSAVIDGQGPYPFTIDTAADRSVVSDRLAAALALPSGRPLRMHAANGAGTVASVAIARLAVGHSEQHDLQVPVLGEGALGAPGLLGLDALAGKRVVIDFKAQRMTLRSVARANEPEPSDPNVIVVTARSRFGQLILTDVRLNGRKVYAIIDTGAENTIGNNALRQLLAGKAALPTSPATLIDVAGQRAPTELASIPSIAIAGMEVKGMPVAFADVHTFRLFKVDRVPALLIGMDVLRTFDRVAIDFRRRRIQFHLPTGQADGGAQLASATSRAGVRICGSSCASPPGG